MSLLISEVLVWASSAFGYIVFSVFLTLILAWIFKEQRKLRYLRHVPGSKYSIFGLSDQMVNRSSEERIKLLIKFGKMGEVVKIWSGIFPICLVSSARGAEVILTSQRHLDKGMGYYFLSDWLGKGLLTSSGSRWHSHRKLLTPAFHFKILEDFIDVINCQSNILVKKLQEKADGKAFDIFPYITYCALDIICETAMGRTVNAQSNSDSDYVRAVNRFSKLMIARATVPWLRPKWLYKYTNASKEYDACLEILHSMSQQTLEERRVLLKNTKKKEITNEEGEVFGKKRRLAFLDLLLEYAQDGANLSDQDIREEVDTFMFEGHDTTAAAINWALYLIGLHPEIQSEVHKELDSIFGNSERFVTMDDLRSMKFLENCVKESLRLFPSVHRFARTLQDDAMICGYLIPSGTNVMIFPYGIHRDPQHFPDPEKFDPDRFLPENVKNRHPYAYIPFSAGPRNCIGQKFAMMEEKIILSNILRKYRVESTVPREEKESLDHFILRPKGGNILKLFPRSS